MELPEIAQENLTSLGRVGVPVVFAVAAMVAAASAWGVIAVSHSRLDATIADVSELKTQVLPTALEMQHVKDRLEGVEASLERIENKLGTK